MRDRKICCINLKGTTSILYNLKIMSSLKKNVIFSSILTISNYFFPLITFPYISRVLGVCNIGICNFVDSIVNYFILFSMMGIVATGIREVANSKFNITELNKVFSSLIMLNLISSFVAICVLLFVISFVPQLHEYSNMFYIGAGKILANAMLIEWLYKGLEEFRFITLRTILIRSLYVLSVFVFVTQPDDYDIYFCLTFISIAINAIVNLLYSRNFVKFTFDKISIKPYLNSFFILGVYLLLTSMYVSFNVAYLGFVTDTTEVGYYTTATKLYNIIMGFFTAFTGVMLPKMSSLIAENKIDEARRFVDSSVEILWAFSIPIVIISEVCAFEIIEFIAGSGYEGAVLPMKIVMPLMMVIGYEQIMILQILMPLKKDTEILRNSIWGALVAVVFNVLLVSHWGKIGTAVVWIISELTVLISAQYYVNRFLNIHFPVKSLMMRLVVSAPIFFMCVSIKSLLNNGLFALIIIAVFVFIIWTVFEYFVFKNKLIISNIMNLSNKLIKKG